eukprot:CAMPEP_0118653774 /NCGR_PEP_ID=MMETSP0785-20121206/12011_1 /TAXON_ID=91992 /ORGANISM="Bolidomonas pacifica, Strain CCMP 1866" /LENGTH=151 /DNA_ID=CAMNT_0006546341 /DNA_START=110 /DNA_END=562 /DNA_ORIENTATION=+
MNAGKKGKPQPKVKHVGCLGTLTPSPVISPWKTPTQKTPSPTGSVGGGDDRPQRKISFNEIVEEEKRERKISAPQAGGGGEEGNKWFIERRVRGDSLEAIQLEEEEKRQKDLMIQREKEELERLKKEHKDKRGKTKPKGKADRRRKRRGGN